MKKQLLLSLGLVFCAAASMAQQKIKDGTVTSTNLPNKDALLELESANKGLIHARVALRSTTDAFPLSAHVAGMMVYNTATAGDVVPGIYYNDGVRWYRIAQGTTGVDGKSVISGATAPGTGTGKPGDT